MKAITVVYKGVKATVMGEYSPSNPSYHYEGKSVEGSESKFTIKSLFTTLPLDLIDPIELEIIVIEHIEHQLITK